MLPRNDQTTSIMHLPWGVTAMILMKLSDGAGLAPKTHNRDAGALISTCRQMRAVSLRLRGDQFFGRYYFLSQQPVKQVYESGHKINNYYALNTHLRRAYRFSHRHDIDIYGVLCLTGQLELIELVIAHTHVPLSAERLFYLCYLTALSENIHALRRITEAVNFNPTLITSERENDSRGILLSNIIFMGSRQALRIVIEYLGRDFVTEHLSKKYHYDIYNEQIASVFQMYEPYYLKESKSIFEELLPYCTTTATQHKLQEMLNRCARDKINFVKLFLKNKIPISDKALITTAEYHSLDILKLMLATDPILRSRLAGPTHIGYTMLEMAATVHRDTEYIEFLLNDCGLDINGVEGSTSALHGAVKNGGGIIFEWVMARNPFIDKLDGNLKTPLQAAFGRVMFGCAAKNVTTLIRAGARTDINDSLRCILQNMTSLDILDLGILDSLIQKGVAINEESERQTNSRIPTPVNFNLNTIINMQEECFINSMSRLLLLACQHGMFYLTTFLIQNGADINHTFDASIAILTGPTNKLVNCSGLSKMLLERDEVVRCVSGFTALDLAISFGHEELVEEIVQYYPTGVIYELLVSRHIDSRLTSYDLAIAVGNSVIIETLGSRMRSHRP
jgi:hypothetical protein